MNWLEGHYLCVRCRQPVIPGETGFIHGLWLEKQYNALAVVHDAMAKRLEEAEGKLTGIKKAGSTRTSGGAPAVIKPTKASHFFKSAEDSLSELDNPTE